MYVCVYVCVYVWDYLTIYLYIVRIYTSQPKCGVIVLYTDDVRRFFSTLKSNGPIKYIPHVCVCMFIRVYVCM